mmetsp:Transcript_1575/g.3321  ORF Transcript_1575/g.3321 Transcript_1575/m.3321 type:complete len:215 (-) Transcript_1575:84-728(-)
MSGTTLHQKSCSCPHGKTSILNFLNFQTFKCSRISLAISERVKAEITWFAFSRFSSSRSSDSTNSFSNHNHYDTKGNILRMRVPNLPERIHLAFRSGNFAPRSGSKNLNLQNPGNSNHRNSSVLNFGLAKPIKINANVVDIGQTKRVKTNIACHGSVKQRRAVHKGKSSRFLRIESYRTRRSGGRWSKGRGIAGHECKKGKLHDCLISTNGCLD